MEKKIVKSNGQKKKTKGSFEMQGGNISGEQRKDTFIGKFYVYVVRNLGHTALG